VKHENHTQLGAFKLRGGLEYIARLRQREPNTIGVISATRGNHGQSVAFAARRSGLKAVIVVPHGNSVEKNAAMRALGAELIEHGEDFQAALDYARHLAPERNLHSMPAFHLDLVRGIAVSSLNFFRSAPGLDVVFVPVGMGSGICATMAMRDGLNLGTKIVGVVAAQAPAYAQSFRSRRGEPCPARTKIADGLACSTPNAEALDFILRGVERVEAVEEEEIAAAMRVYFTDTHNVAEGAAAAPLAAILREKDRLAGKKVGVILSGGNVDRDKFSRVLAGDAG
jgi:threonine dehydratase